MEPFRSQGSRVLSSTLAVFGKNVPDTETRQWFASVVAKQLFSRGSFNSTFDKEVFQQSRRLRPQRTEPFFSSFAKEPRVEWFVELNITGTKIENLLDPRAGVEHCRQHCVVATTAWTFAVDSRENSLELTKFKVFHCRHWRPLERNPQDSLG